MLLGAIHRPGLDVVLVDEFHGLFLGQELLCLLDAQLAGAGAAAAEVVEHGLELLGHLLHTGRGHDLDADPGGGDLGLDLAIGEPAVLEHLAEALAGRGAALVMDDAHARGREQDVEQALLGGRLGWARTRDMASSRVILTAMSARSRMMDWTLRPTYPISVNLVASTLRKGASASLASRRAISVLPTPVGPIINILLGVISLRRSARTCSRRQRLRSAMATARLAAS